MHPSKSMRGDGSGIRIAVWHAFYRAITIVPQWLGVAEVFIQSWLILMNTMTQKSPVSGEKSEGQKSVFDSFTHKYALSKTLRFELVPVHGTENLLKVFKQDKWVDDNYHKIKYYFDLLHREFINVALGDTKFDIETLKKYQRLIEGLKKTAKKSDDGKKLVNDIELFEEKLRKILVTQLDNVGKEWKKDFVNRGVSLKKDGVAILAEKGVLDILKLKFVSMPVDDENVPDLSVVDVDGKVSNLFAAFDKSFGRLENYTTSKKNLYVPEDKTTSVANRVVNENLRRFVENAIQFDEAKTAYRATGFSEIEQQLLFQTKFYNNYLSQAGIDAYNTVIGDLNKKINEYKQTKLDQFAPLHKQIMSKRDKAEMDIEIEDDADVYRTLQELQNLGEGKLPLVKQLMNELWSGKYDFEKIYIKNTAINTISNKWFGTWDAIRDAINFANGKKKSRKTIDSDALPKLPDLVPIAALKSALNDVDVDRDALFRDVYKDEYKSAKSNFDAFLSIWKKEWEACVEEYERSAQEVSEMMQKGHYRKDNEQQIEKMHTFCEAARAIQQMMKYLSLEKGYKPIVPAQGYDKSFYNQHEKWCQEYPASKYFDAFRNYLTKKTHLGRLLFPSLNNDDKEQRHQLSKRKTDGAEKINLNFGEGALLKNWSKTRDTKGDLNFEGHGTLLKIDTSYHLLISKKAKVLNYQRNESMKAAPDEKDQITVYDMQQLSFKTFAGRGYVSEYKMKYSTDPNVIEHTKKWILKRYQKVSGLMEIAQKTYASKKDLEKDITEALSDYYEVKNVSIKRTYLDEALRSEGAYLFRIESKDLSQDVVHKTPNLHTRYFELMLDENSGSAIKMNGGGAAVFFRPNQELNKEIIKDASGSVIDAKGDRPIYHKRRYIEERSKDGEQVGGKLFLHVPFTLNFGAKDKSINREMLQCIAVDKKHKEIKIIGIDRGEKHLAYMAMIDQDGKLLDSGPLDGKLPNDRTYLQKLEEVAGNRDEARKKWKTIQGIKELKSGYISQVVHTLTDMMIKNNAVLVFEDLSIGFKRGRQKIEQQVYQKLELAIAKKLNYLVNKSAPEGSNGHYLQGYQLTPEIKTPKDIGKQCGALFYVSPAYTSLTCPKCGFRKNTKFQYETIDQAKELIEKCKLRIEECDKGYEVKYVLENKNSYKLYSDVTRVHWHKKGTDYAKNRGNGEEVIETTSFGVSKRYNITECLKSVLNNVVDDIGTKSVYTTDELTIPNNSNFYRNLFRYLDLLLQSRNSISGTDKDYIECPHCLFHSDNGFCGHEWNGDANGAYNIARKGLLTIRKVQNASDPAKMKWADMKVDIVDWDEWAISHGLAK